MSFRKEKKFRLTLSDFQILKFSLFEKGMNELYPERKVQSYYYDTKDLKMLEDSDEGILPRKKIIVRKYKRENTFRKSFYKIKWSIFYFVWQNSEIFTDYYFKVIFF